MTNPSASSSSSDADVAGETFQRIEVISGTGRRRKWSRRRKESIVLETLEEGASVPRLYAGTASMSARFSNGAAMLG